MKPTKTNQAQNNIIWENKIKGEIFMNVSTYEFKYSLFGKRVQMFHEGRMAL